MMLRVHTVSQYNLIKDAIKYNWTDYTVAVIKEIASVWFYSNIADSVLLFFKEGVNGCLHSYMPIVSKYKGKVPDVKDYEGEKGEAKIIGIEPYLKTFEISDGSFRYKDDDAFIAGFMEKYHWIGNEVFIMQIDITPFIRESLKKKPASMRLTTGGVMRRGIARKIAKPPLIKLCARGDRERPSTVKIAMSLDLEKVAMRRSSSKIATNKKLAVLKTAVKKPAVKKSTAKKTSANKPAAKKTTAKKPAIRKTAAKKPAVKKSTGKKLTAKKGKKTKSVIRKNIEIRKGE